MRIRLYANTFRGVRCAEEILRLTDDLVVVYDKPSKFEPDYTIAMQRLRESGADVYMYGDEPTLLDAKPDLVLCVNWRRKIEVGAMRSTTRAYVFHDSLLPHRRGFSPTFHAVLERDRQAGVTLFCMTDQIDGGPIVTQRSFDLNWASDRWDISHVVAEITELYVEVLRSVVPLLVEGWSLPEHAQDESQVSYCPRIDWANPESRLIKRDMTKEQVQAHIRAWHYPYPTATVQLDTGGIVTVDSIKQYENLMREGRLW